VPVGRRPRFGGRRAARYEERAVHARFAASSRPPPNVARVVAGACGPLRRGAGRGTAISGRRNIVSIDSRL
jgi:hypothetical protein